MHTHKQKKKTGIHKQACADVEDCGGHCDFLLIIIAAGDFGSINSETVTKDESGTESQTCAAAHCARIDNATRWNTTKVWHAISPLIVVFWCTQRRGDP